MLAAAVLLVGCGWLPDDPDDLESWAPKEEMALSRHLLRQLQAGEIDALYEAVAPELKDLGTRAKILEMSQAFPEGEPLEARLFGLHIHHTNSSKTYNFNSQFRFTYFWVIANVAFVQRQDGTFNILGLSANRSSASLQRIHAFTLRGRTALHYAVLASAVLVPIFIIVSFIAAIRTPGLRWKWLWCIGILFGIGSLTLNWTSGQLNVQPITLQLLGAGYVRANSFTAWQLSIAIPVPAILFWWKRNRFLTAIGAPGAATPPDATQ